MAQQVQIILVDDLDGGPANETLTFALDGTSYEIDLSATNAATLRSSLSRYVSAGRKVARTAKARGRSAGDGRSAQIRSWARAQGIAVPERGRIPADLAARYDAAH